jgi:hypothetical protein
MATGQAANNIVRGPNNDEQIGLDEHSRTRLHAQIVIRPIVIAANMTEQTLTNS